MSDLDKILALLTGRKTYDTAARQWKIHDTNAVELADPGGVLLAGLHGWLLRTSAPVASVVSDAATHVAYPGACFPFGTSSPIPARRKKKRRTAILFMFGK